MSGARISWPPPIGVGSLVAWTPPRRVWPIPTQLTDLEGEGEVQTPLTGAGSRGLARTPW